MRQSRISDISAFHLDEGARIEGNLIEAIDNVRLKQEAHLAVSVGCFDIFGHDPITRTVLLNNLECRFAFTNLMDIRRRSVDIVVFYNFNGTAFIVIDNFLCLTFFGMM